MPRVVPDQKAKYETDELFKKLCQDVDVSILLTFYPFYVFKLCTHACTTIVLLCMLITNLS